MFEMCCPVVVIDGIHCVTGGVPVGSLGLFMRFIDTLSALIGVIGHFETARAVLRRSDLGSALSRSLREITPLGDWRGIRVVLVRAAAASPP
jgi:hypothetical protein